MPELRETIRQKFCLIPLPQYHGKNYIESIPIQYKCYKVIGEVKKDDGKELLETQSTHTTNELAVLGNDLLSPDKGNTKENSTISNLTLSDSELVLSDSEISQDILEDIACRESIKLLQGNIEGKQAGIKLSKVFIGAKENELKDSYEIIKDIQGKIEQKKLEVSSYNIREENLKNRLSDLDTELNNMFIYYDSDIEIKKLHELKHKFMTCSRATEICKKHLINIQSTVNDSQKNYNNRENELYSLRQQLENFKYQNRNHEGKAHVKLLEVNKEILLSQLNSNFRLTQEILDNIQTQIDVNIEKLLKGSSEYSQEQLVTLICEAKEKSSKFEQKIESNQQKFYKEKGLILENFKNIKEKMIRNQKISSDEKTLEISEKIKIFKENLRLELQSQRLNELNITIDPQELEKNLSRYQVKII